MASSATLIIGLIAALIFGIIGIYMSKLQLGSRSSYSLDWFLTARNSQSWIKVGLAFFGASIGIWCFFPYFSYDNEISFKSQLIILLLSALAASYPVILLAYVGDIMKTKYPTARSVADYASLRFGKPVAIYVSCICIINLAIPLIREFILLGKLFGDFSGYRTYPVVFIGLISLLLVTFGGLPVILTINRYQSTIGLLLLIILFTYVLSLFDIRSLHAASEGVNLSSSSMSPILAIFFSKPSWLFFTDGVWQRALAAESRIALRKGAWFGGFLVFCTIFSFRFMAYLGFLDGVSSEPQLSFAGIFMNAPEWASVCLVLCGVCMSQGIILVCFHSLTASVVSLSSLLGFRESLHSTRMISLFLHLPIIVIGILPLETYNSFLIGNLLTISSVFPLLLGLVPSLEDYMNGTSVLLGCAFSLSSVFIFGYLSTGHIINGIFRYLFDEYSWQPLIVALLSSLIGVALSVMIEMGLYSCSGKPYISDIKTKDYIASRHYYETTVALDETS